MGAEVELGWDNSELYKGTKAAENRISRFDQKLEKSLGGANKVAGFLSRNLAAVGGGLAVGTLAADAFNRSVSFESLRRGFEAIVGDADEAAVQMQRLRDIAEKPGVGFRTAVALSRDLQAAGFAARESEKMISEVANAVALMGGGENDVANVVDAMKDLVAEGALVDDKVDRIAERLPQVRQLMMEAFGSSSTTAVREMGVSAEEFLAVITDKLATEVPRAAETTKTAIENLKDTWDQFLTGVGDELNSEDGSLGRAIGGLRGLLEGLILSDATGIVGADDDNSPAAQYRRIQQGRPAVIGKEEPFGPGSAGFNFDNSGEVDRTPGHNTAAIVPGLEMMLEYAAATGQAVQELEKKAALEKESEARQAALREKAELTQQTVEALQAEMAVLALKAKGQHEAADALAREVELREEAAQLAERTNLTEGEALDMLKEKDALAKQAADRANADANAAGESKRRIRIKGADEPRLTMRSFQGIDGTTFPMLDEMKKRAAMSTAAKPAEVKRKTEAETLLAAIQESNERTAAGIEELVSG